MAIPLRLDPIFEKKSPPKEKPKEVREDLLIKYRSVVNDIIAFRIKIMVPIGIVLHLAFSYLDAHTPYAAAFFRIRVVDSFLLLIVLAASFARTMRKHVVWCSDVGIIVITAGVSLMIYFIEGASSRYYEGIYLTLLALPIVNSFYFWHNVGTCVLALLLYTVAAIGNRSGWNFTDFCYASYFIGSTGFLVVLMTKFYSSQHFNAFVRNEELKESERKLEILYGMAEEKAKIDDLTKIYNRRYFFEILAEKIKTCEAQGSFFYLIIFDIDHFKEINDTYGHAFGDQVITAVAQTIKDTMRMNSYIGRYGGDEFMVIIDKATKEEFFHRTQMISNAIRNISFSYSGKKVQLTASFGAARFDPDRMSNETKLIELADQALLGVKRTKRGEIKLAE